MDFGTTPLPDSFEDFYPEAAEVAPIGPTNSLRVHPNPAQNTLSLKWEQGNLINSEVLIFNTSGQLMLHHQINNSGDIKLSIQHLPPGSYILKVFKNKQSIGQQKLVINR